jgi:hypothetical protein
MHRSATLSGCLDHMMFIQNVVGDNRSKVKMKIVNGNNGGSQVILGSDKALTNNVICKLNKRI